MIESIDTELSEAEVERRRDAALRRLLRTPPKPQKAIGKKREAKKQAAEKKPAK